jgi:CubicO group peptidase (beta-lactamase class C family)/predicted O-methyltransferase YrrM
MKQWMRIGILAAVFTAAPVFPAPNAGPFGCTIVMASRDGLVLAGNNEDRNHPHTIVTFVPASGRYFGRVVFGYDDGFAQGGMNDQGLFIDGNALKPTDWKGEPDKPTFRGIVTMVVLGTCATCQDVRTFFEKYNVPALSRARFPVADRTGDSMVVEYGQGRVQFVKSETWYQIATNFVMSNVTDGNYPCWRYRAADVTLSAAEKLSVDLIKDVLDKTHQKSGSPTVYSNIYDLKKGLIHVYSLGNFKDAVVLNLSEELEKGQRRLALASLFQPQATVSAVKPTLDGVLRRYFEALGGKDAIEKIETRKLSGELTHEFPGQEPPKLVLPAEVIAAAPDKWRLVLKTAAGTQQMGYDGKRGWTQDADRILIDNRQARSRLAYLFNPQAALRVEDYLSQLSFKGEAVSDGRAKHVVEAKDSRGSLIRLYFDAETGLLSRLGDNVEVKDYRREAGVLHPVRIAVARRGGISTYVFDKVEVNAVSDEESFAVPALDKIFPGVFEGLPEAKVLPLLKDFPSEHEDMNVPCRDGRFLHDLIVRKGYKRGLEIGTFTGYSALWMGWAFEKTGGKLITIEIDQAPGEKARKNVKDAGLPGAVDVRIADAFAEIPRIEGGFDFVFIDAWKPDYVKFLKLIRDRVALGGVIVAHNVTNYARDMKDFLEAIRADPGLETTFEELSAEGMSVSFVRGTPQTPSSWSWPQSTPDEQGMDSEKLEGLVNEIRRGELYPRLHGLLIVRHGSLVVEEYFNDWQADRLHMLQSVSKSFTSALVGIAIARGEFKGVDERVLDFFPDTKGIANMDERKVSMRLRDILTMRTGTDYHERGPDPPHFQLNRLVKGWDKFYLDRPMLRPPGTFFQYDSGGVILLSAMLKSRTGMHAAEYAERFLFKPLGIEKKFWFANGEGHTHTGGGLALTARDTAKFGLLFLRNGRWGSEQVVPEEWVRLSSQMHVEFEASGPKGPGAIGYGYLWWILFPDRRGKEGQDMYAAIGKNAQYIFIVPEHDMVVVVLGDTRTSADQNKPIQFLYEDVLPAIRR